MTVDGAFAGLTPVVVPLSPGDRHAISLSKAGYLGASLALTLARGEAASRAVTLKPELGEVRFAIEPAEAEILINGQRVGAGSQSLSLPAVQQRIAVQLEGYASFETEVLPKPGLPQQISVTLLTEAAARKAAAVDAAMRRAERASRPPMSAEGAATRIQAIFRRHRAVDESAALARTRPPS